MSFCCLSSNTQDITQITRWCEKLKSHRQRQESKLHFQQSLALNSFCQALLASSNSSTTDSKCIDLFFRFPPTNSYKILAQNSRDFHFSFPRCQHCVPSRMPQQLKGQVARLYPKALAWLQTFHLWELTPLSEGFQRSLENPSLGDVLTKA